MASYNLYNNRISSLWLNILLFAMTMCIFSVDYFTRTGLAVWILYIIPMTISLSSLQPRTPPILALLITILMFTGFGFDKNIADEYLAIMNRSFGFVSLWIMGVVGFIYIKNKLLIRSDEWLNSGLANLVETISGEKTIHEVSDDAIKNIANLLGAKAAVMFVRDKDTFNQEAVYGVMGKDILTKFDESDGILGRAVKDRKAFLLDDIPDKYIKFGSAFGNAVPTFIAVVPMVTEGEVNGVMELGFKRKPLKLHLDFLDRLGEPVSTALRSARYKADLKKYLAERQRQSEELQAQSEELRVTNEELEEQKRALEESQAHLEQQQTEVEQTNTQLEEQTQLLEAQKDELEDARSDLIARARELELASKYKTDFLANMSHELRTPLNSTLILAKLLADNKDGNLTDEQIKFASTIYSAGNDLLNLINDILDLSKIEAGYMEVIPEKVSMKKLSENIHKMFEQMAEKKKLKFNIEVDKSAPKSIISDSKRLEQIIKNLLSNAFKFTDKGSVTFAIKENNDQVEFIVKDTGFGISEDKKEAIFEAFKQVDGTISRQFGGTGLGLSISREFAELLDGRLILRESTKKGSTFALVLPKQLNVDEPVEDKLAAQMASIEPVPAAADDEKPAKRQATFIDDDRDDLNPKKNTILIIEDDVTFAKILFDLIKETKMQCIVAGTAEEGLYLCRTYKPNGVVLDIGLPDHSGLSVLDRLKQDVNTRHIPVHIISGNDFSNTALSLGAKDYMFKPIKRKELVTTIKRLEDDLVKRMRRVLIVEDNETQLQAMKKLIGTKDVKTIGVKTAKECLDELSKGTFDCMVLDLSLPDATGYELLETLSEGGEY